MAAGAYFAWYPFDQSVYTHCNEEQPEAASLTVKRGTPIVLDTNGRIDALGASAGTPYGVITATGQNGTAGQYKNVITRLRAGDVWVIPLLEALAQNLMGQSGGNLGLVKDATTGFWYGSTANSDAQCRIVDWVQIPGGLTIGDTVTAVKVVFHEDKIQIS